MQNRDEAKDGQAKGGGCGDSTPPPTTTMFEELPYLFLYTRYTYMYFNGFFGLTIIPLKDLQTIKNNPTPLQQ